MSLVDNIFKARRNKVVNRSMEGKIEKSRGSFTYNVMNNIIRDKDRLMVRSISIISSLSGRIISNIMNTTTKAMKTSANFKAKPPSPHTCFPLIL
jgi:fibronectin type 3 domain-containing protein